MEQAVQEAKRRTNEAREAANSLLEVQEKYQGQLKETAAAFEQISEMRAKISSLQTHLDTEANEVVLLRQGLDDAKEGYQLEKDALMQRVSELTQQVDNLKAQTNLLHNQIEVCHVCCAHPAHAPRS